MLDQQQLMALFAALADAISAREDANTRIQGIKQQKPKNITTANYIAYKELEAANAWEERMGAALDDLTAKEQELKLAQEQVLAALPEVVKERLENKVPIIIGEDSEFFGLYKRDKELAVLSDQHEQALYSTIYSYYQESNSKGKLGGIQERLGGLYR